jgi:hypothetical protein
VGPPEYHSAGEAIRALQKLYANFEEIEKTPKFKINLKVTAGTPGLKQCL